MVKCSFCFSNWEWLELKISGIKADCVPTLPCNHSRAFCSSTFYLIHWSNITFFCFECISCLHVASHLIMGKKDFFARRDEIAKERRRLQRERNGYVPGAHRQEDSIREKDKRLPKTNRLHQKDMNLWLEWVKPRLTWQSLPIYELCWPSLSFTENPENGFEYYKTSLGSPAPSHEMIKEFIRWYVSSTEGRLNEDGLPTVRTVCAHAERFFGGFEQFTKTQIVPGDRNEIKMVCLFVTSPLRLS